MALTDTLVGIGDAIRSKDGATEPIPFLDMPNRVRAIPSGGDVDGIVDGIVDRTITGTLTLHTTSIQTYALYRCSQLEKIVAPNLTRIYDNGANGCTKLSVLDAPNLAVIGTVGLNNSALASLDAPLTSIAAAAFSNSLSLTTLIIRRDGVCTLSNINAFAGTPIEAGTGYIYVPAAYVSAYKVATNWITIASQIRAIEDWGL